MSRFYCLIATFLLAGCAMAQERSHVVMSEKAQKARTIYLKIKGPEEVAAKLRASFVQAVQDKEMFLADDPHQAGSKVDISIKERNIEKPYYAELVSATLVARDGKSTAVSSCRKVTDGKGYTTSTRKAGRSELMKDVPAKSTVYVEEGSQSAALIQAVEKEIKDAGFTIVSAEKDADFRLKDIKQIKAPVRGTGVEATVKSTINAAGGMVLNSTTDLTTQVSIVEPIGPEAEGCRASLQHVGEDVSNSYQFVAVTDVAMIAQFIR